MFMGEMMINHENLGGRPEDPSIFRKKSRVEFPTSFVAPDIWPSYYLGTAESGSSNVGNPGKSPNSMEVEIGKTSITIGKFPYAWWLEGKVRIFDGNNAQHPNSLRVHIPVFADSQGLLDRVDQCMSERGEYDPLLDGLTGAKLFQNSFLFHLGTLFLLYLGARIL